MATRHKRKNFMVDAEQIRKLAANHQVSESEAVRRAVAYQLEIDEAMAALEKLAENGGLADPLGLLERD